jgi:hypothetical protein
MYLVAVAALVTAVPVSLGILAFFRRRVLRSILPEAASSSRTRPKQDSVLSASDRTPRPPIAWRTLNQAATRHRAGLARVYLLGGVGLAVALAGADAIANVGHVRFSLLRFFFAAICFSTPLALSVRLLYGRWRPSFAIVACQLVAVLVLRRFVPQMPDDPIEVAIIVSPLLALLLHPRVRAMGALATGFLTVVFTGTFVSVAASVFLMLDSIQANILADPRLATIRSPIEGFGPSTTVGDMFDERAIDVLSSFLRDQGLFIVQTIAVLALVGVLASVVLGSLLFSLVARSYARKRLSEQWLLIASVWLFLAVAVASVVSPVVGLPANLACVAVFGLGVATGWRRLPRYEGPNVRLLLLRSFTLGERSNRLFQDLESLWRSIGSIQLVGAVDLALTTLEPHELLDFLRGRSGREFVHCPADVDARLASFDQTRDPDGRFRVNVIFCRGDAIWKYAVNRMLIDSDCVLMDLRGFSRHRAGCVFEIRCLAESDLPFRTAFLVDESTDRGFVSETWAAAATGASARANGDAFQFVSEKPFDMTVSERIIAAFSSPDAHHGAFSHGTTTALAASDMSSDIAKATAVNASSAATAAERSGTSSS